MSAPTLLAYRLEGEGEPLLSLPGSQTGVEV